MCERFELPIAPLPEQRRIVAKIDSLTGKSKRARDHLDHIPRLVEKYKQAVLAAAFRGDLTREWRTVSFALPEPRSARLAGTASLRPSLERPFFYHFVIPGSSIRRRVAFRSIMRLSALRGGGQSTFPTFDFADILDDKIRRNDGFPSY